MIRNATGKQKTSRDVSPHKHYAPIHSTSLLNKNIFKNVFSTHTSVVLENDRQLLITMKRSRQIRPKPASEHTGMLVIDFLYFQMYVCRFQPIFRSLLKTNPKVPAVLQAVIHLHSHCCYLTIISNMKACQKGLVRASLFDSVLYTSLDPERLFRTSLNLSDQEGCVLTKPAWIRNKQTLSGKKQLLGRTLPLLVGCTDDSLGAAQSCLSSALEWLCSWKRNKCWNSLYSFCCQGKQNHKT